MNTESIQTLGRGVDAPSVVSVQRTAERLFLDGETESMDNKEFWDRMRCETEPGNVGAFAVPEDALRAFKIAAGTFVLNRHEDLFEPPTEQYDNLQAIGAAIASRPHELCMLYNGDLIKSPIEGQLAAALLWQQCDWAGFPTVHDHFDYVQERTHASAESIRAFLTPQAPIAGYKVDLLLWFRYGRKIGGVAIECDGHVFHEKTKEQAARDKKRDRELLAAGFPVMRFSGSEIYKDPVACCGQIWDVAASILERVTNEGRSF